MTKEEQLAVFKKIVSINTVDGNEAEVADYIDSLFKPYEGDNVKIEHVPHSQGRDNLVITIGHGDRVLGFSGACRDTPSSRPGPRRPFPVGHRSFYSRCKEWQTLWSWCL